MEEIIKRLRAFTEERDWKQFHTPENLAKSIVIESAELLEHFQWNNQVDQEALGEELADVMSYCLMLADSLDIDMVETMHKKIDKNSAKYPVEKAKGTSKKYTEL